MKMAIKTKPFNVSDHLNTYEDICIFLQEANDADTEAELIHSLSTAALLLRLKSSTAGTQHVPADSPS